MAETALNFGPDWIRALASGSQGAEAAPTTMSVPRYKLAEHRYGREEMLGLIPKHPRAPESLKQFEHLAKHNFQIPLALTPMTEEEQYLWTSRYLNSEASLRGKSGPGGYGMNRTGRGGSVDRGRGRGRGSYYQRGMIHDDLPEGPPFPRQKTIERSLSANEKDHRWDERDRRYDRTYSGRGGNDDTYLKHDNTRGQQDSWRKYDDEGDWRSAGSRSYDKLANRGSWRSERDRRDPPDYRNHPQNRGGNTRGGGASPGPQRQGGHSSWKDDGQGHLPEWSVEEVAEPDTVGTFDSSGAFLETKASEESASLDEIYVSDDADEGSTTQDSPEAKKESSKKTPKKPANKPSANSKKNSKSPSEAKNVEETELEETSTPPKTTPKGARGKSKEKQQSPEPKPPQKNPESSPGNQTPRTTNSGKATTKTAESRDSKNAENSSVSEEDAFAYHQKATENMVAQWTEEIEQRVTPHTEEASLPTRQEKDTKWFYQDPQGEIQGPFASHEMLEWFSSGYFTMSLMVRRSCDETFSQLGELIKSWGRVPFMPGTSPPPIRAAALPSPLPSSSIPPNIPAAPPGGQIPKPDEQLLQLQQQLFQQQLMQQQLMLRQAQMQQLLTQLKTQDNFASLTSQQQQQVLMQQLAMAQIPRPGLKPMGDPPSLLDPMAAMAHPLMGLPLPPMMKSDLWQTAPEQGPWPVNVSTPQPPGGSIWDVDLSKPSETELEKQNKLSEEQEKMRKAEELRLQQERELEEQRQNEELRRKQEEEEERNRLEELRRAEAERQLKEELKRLEEKRLREEAEAERQRQQQEELRRRKREEEKRKKEEEELKRQEEHRRKEEERRQQEEAKRLAEMRKTEEKRKREEIQRQKENEKLVEVERQRELLRQKEAEREERLLREKREREEAELRKLAELKIKTQGPVWGIQRSQSSSDAPLSLADIQRIQEEKEREERDERVRQQLLQQQAVKQVQVVKNGLTWAKRANDCPPVVKSLSEIQQEEAERLAQLSRMQKPQAPAPPVNSNAGVWGNSSHLNKITSAPSGWNVSNHSSLGGGFWDDALSSTQPKKQAPVAKSSDNAFPSLVVPAKPVVSNKSKNSRAKKEEDAVSRLFGSHHKPTDEFTKWCTDAISAMPSSVDVPTFVAFLKDIESPYEVFDYVKSYFGEGKEPREFAKLFLEKRSKFRNQAKQAPAEDNSLWGPAPAITPTVNKPPAPPNNDASDGGFVVKGKSKKKKGKMQRLDASMLGFTVQPSPDRVNAGEIDHVDHNL